ncbi:MAG: hypothetical protein ACTHMV_16005 [Chitinophagaceae bacterium]
MSLDKIKTVLKSRFPDNLVNELTDCYSEQKRNFFLGNHRPNEIEGGRFSEAAFRLLEHFVGFTTTPLGTQINTDSLIRSLQQLSSSSFNDSVRLHIPRTLRVIYDIRNKRDVAHLADGIDPNLQDSSFVFSALDWVLAEFIRMSGGTTPEEAFSLVKGITIHSIPAIEDFDGFLKTLRPSIGPSDRILLLLYHKNTIGATQEQLKNWLKPSQRANIKRDLNKLEHEKDFITLQNGKYLITRLGIIEVQKKKLLEL